MRVLREIGRDVTTVARTLRGAPPTVGQLVSTMSNDGSVVLTLSRLAEAARRHRVPLLGGVMRRLQTSLFGIEISRDARLGEGVVFLHTVGVVIGGDSRIGDRVLFLGSITIGSVNNGGYPTIGNDVVIGAGARILGPVTIGNGASIGANAVVLSDVPAGAVAVGVPAVVRSRREPRKTPQSPPSPTDDP
jgi:serine acetyltransferase